MNIRPKTIRRLILLAAIVSMIAVLGAGMLAWHSYSKRKQLRAERAAGLELFQQGDYVAAYERLKRCVSTRNEEDYEGQYALAVSRFRVETPNNSHIKEARERFLDLLAKRPNDLPTSHVLMELYAQISYNSEAIDLADKVLALHPADETALRIKSQSLTRTSKYADALVTARKLNEVAPRDLEAQIQTRELMIRLKRTPDELITHFGQLQKQYPDDPRFELLLGAAYAYAQDVPQTLKWLRQAATRRVPDANFARRLSRAFDDLKLFDESQALLERASDVADDPAITRVLVERLWQNDRHEELVQRLSKLDPASPKTDATLLAYRAMSLHELQRADESKKIVDALTERKGSGVAQSWAIALATRFDPNTAPRQTIARYESALARNPDNAVLAYWIGESYLRVGETELALKSFSAAAEQMPSWSKAHIMVSRTSLALGRTDDALNAARAARKSAPNQLLSARAYALAWYEYLDENPDPEQSAAILQFVRLIQDQKPNDPETLPIYVSLLARNGKVEQAREVLRAAMANPSAMDGDLLARLLSVSRTDALGLDSEILQAMPAQLASSPRIMLERAMDLAKSGKVAEGLDLLTRNARLEGPDASTWKLLICQYRDAVNDPQAKAAWIALGDAEPNNAVIQTAILKYGRSARSDREFYARTIDNVRKLTTDAGRLWRAHRARWLMGEKSQKDLAEAVSLMTDLVRVSPGSSEYRVLLAQALLTLPVSKETTQNAIVQLKAAVDLEPGNVAAALSLARLLIGQNDLETAKGYLTRVARLNKSVEQCQELAILLAQTGAMEQAYDVLRPRESELDAAGLLMLAELTRRQGKPDDAQRLFAQLLRNPQIQPEAIAAAADFHASRGQKSQAQAALDRLNEQRITPIQRERILARFHESHGTPEEARRHYRAVIADSAGGVQSWKDLISFEMRIGAYDQALASSDEGLRQFPDHADLLDLRAQAMAVKATTGDNGDLQPLIDVLSRDPKNASQVELLKLIQEVRVKKLPPDQAVARLKPIAEKNPDHFPTQSLLIRWYLAANRVTDAATVAERAMELRPNDPEAAQLAVGIYQSAGRWREMKRSAEKWRQRTLDQPQKADYALAESQYRLGEFEGAARQVEPYLEASISDPQANPLPLRISAQALVKLKQIDAAQELLQPLLPESIVARELAIDLAARDIPDVSIARQWLETIQPLVPTDSESQQLALARGWQTLGQRLKDNSSLERARALLRSIQTSAGVECLMVLGNLEFELGDPVAAETVYRQILQKQPEPDAQNNLAYLILARGGDAAEAKELASRAVEARAESSSFHDTLARALRQSNDRPAAVAQFQEAIRLNPRNLEAMVGLAAMLSANGASEQSAELLRQIDQLIKEGVPLSPLLTVELQTARSVLQKTAPQ